MAVVKEFDVGFALIETNNKRSDISIQEEFEVNPHLSHIITYMYMTTMYMSDTSRVIIKSPYYNFIKRMFNDANNVLDAEPDDGNEGIDAMPTWVMNVVNYDKTFKHGAALMPMFTSSLNLKVHNIHTVNAEGFTSNHAHVKGCLNFFNGYVRSGKGGITRIIWKDPIMSDSKLQKFTYDQMFGLYVCDKYLARVDIEYLSETLNMRLAMSLSCLDMLVKEADSMYPKSDAQVRNIYSYLDKAMIAFPFTEFNTTRAEQTRSALEVNISMSYYAAVLSFLSMYKLKNDSVFTFMIYGMFETYNFIDDLANKMYPKAKFIVWAKDTAVIPTGSNITYKTGRIMLSKSNYDQHYLFSLFKSNDTVLNNVLNGFKGGRALVHPSSTTHKPVKVIMPLFAQSTTEVYVIVDMLHRELVPFTDHGKDNFMRDVAIEYDEFNTLFRNTRSWMYSLTTRRNAPTASYDRSYVTALEELTFSA